MVQQIWSGRRGFLGFAMVFATLLVNALLGYLNVRRLHHSRQEVEHSHETLLAAEGLLSTLLDAETGQRGYLITGEDSYLQPFRAAVSRFEERAGKFERLVAHDAEQSRAAANVVANARKALDVLQQRIDVRAASGLEVVRQLVKLGVGKRILDEIRLELAVIVERERRVLAQRESEANDNYVTAIVTGLISTALSIGLAAGSYVLVRRDIATRARATAELQRAKEFLEQRVVDRTRELRLSNQSLQAEVETRRQAEQESRGLAEELQRSNRELEQFASVASHDMQEPLRKIQAFADRLNLQCRAELGEKGQDYLQRILSAAARMRRLIDDLLAFSRVATKGQPFVPVDLRKVALDVVDDLEQRIQETAGTITIGDLPCIEADALQMRQLFQNLIANALKFHRPDAPPAVAVSGGLQDGSCVLTFVDNGIGFDPVYADRIFNLFQRLHAREAYEGTGIGLAICKKIVERHGGEIVAESAPGAGATFTVTLPAVHAELKE